MSAPEVPAGWSRKPACLVLPILLLFALLGGGCAPLVRGDQPARTAWTSLSAGETLGQTFTARYSGLSGIELYLAPVEPGEGQLLLRLWGGPHSAEDLASASLPLDAVVSPAYYRFQLPPQPASTGQDYFASLELQGEGAIRAGTAPGEAYLNGALYHGREPQDAQLAFRLVYDPGQAAWGLLGEGLGWLWALAIGLFLFAIPGWAALSRLLPGWRQLSWGEKLGLAVGVSLAFYPLLFLWTHLVGLQLGSLYAWGPPLIGLAVLALPVVRDGLPRWERLGRSIRFLPARIRGVAPADLATLALAALIFATRFWVIRSLDVPLWGDSYQHTLITQLLVENGGLFRSWAPYAELQTFTYHFGFHTLAAVFHWITRMPAPQAVLWTGQILNGLAVLALYPLAVRFGRSRWAGVAAILLAGLLSPMPMYYVNWGRYTQLAGQVMLPAAVYLIWESLAGEKIATSHQRSAIRSEQFLVVFQTCLILAGLALTHYRVLIFALLFIPALFALSARREQIRNFLVNTAWIGLGAWLIFLPWGARVMGGKLVQIFARQAITPAGQVSAFIEQYNAVGSLAPFLPIPIWLLFIMVVAWGLFRRERGAVLISLWSALVVLAANPGWLGLPGTGLLSNFAVMIAAYLPAGILIGAGVGWTLEYRAAPFPVFRLVLLIAVLGLGLAGARARLRDAAIAEHALVTRPDLRAAAWIKVNTPQTSRFLVNSFLAYGDTLVAGSDAGWWLPLIAHRATTLPPINYSSEQGPRTDYLEWTNALTTALKGHDLEEPLVLEILKERGITHVYVGQRQGQVGNPGLPLLRPGQLSGSPFFRLVYHQDRVWIFERLE